jgi:hypothetical protein
MNSRLFTLDHLVVAIRGTSVTEYWISAKAGAVMSGDSMTANHLSTKLRLFPDYPVGGSSGQ